MHPVRVGLKLIPQVTTVETLRQLWQIADESGFDHCWIYDHFLPTSGGAPPEGDVFEAWTLLGAIAALTSRVRMGTLVTGNSYRHPGILAKMVVTVDHLSGGRLECAIGSGWAEREHMMFGLEYGSPGQRIDRLDEACQIFKSLWTEDVTNFEGRYYHITEALAFPKPIQKPYPPLWLGGRGERKMLRVVARHADVWNIASRDLADDTRLSGVLDGYCEEIGRDRSEIRRSAQLYFRGDQEATLAEAERYIAAGFSEIILTIYDDPPLIAAATLATEVLPRIRQLG